MLLIVFVSPASRRRSYYGGKLDYERATFDRFMEPQRAAPASKTEADCVDDLMKRHWPAWEWEFEPL